MSYHHLTSNPSLQSVRFFLQTRFRCKVAPPSRHSLALRARTDIGCPRSRAKKCPLSRAGRCRVEREVSKKAGLIRPKSQKARASSIGVGVPSSERRGDRGSSREQRRTSSERRFPCGKNTLR